MDPRRLSKKQTHATWQTQFMQSCIMDKIHNVN